LQSRNRRLRRWLHDLLPRLPHRPPPPRLTDPLRPRPPLARGAPSANQPAPQQAVLGKSPEERPADDARGVLDDLQPPPDDELARLRDLLAGQQPRAPAHGVGAHALV